MNIAMVSEHASPLAVIGGVDAGGQNIHVAALARELARRGHSVIVHTRRDNPDLPRRVPFAPGVVVDHVDAGPPCEIPKDDLLPYMDAFADDLRATWECERPDVVHSHFWMSGLASLRAAATLDAPVVHTFHALGVVKRRHQGDKDTSPPERIAVETMIVNAADHVVATCSDEVFELVRMGADSARVSVVPCGVDLDHFRARRPPPRDGGPVRVLALGRLVERKGVGNVISALAHVDGAELWIAGGPARDRMDSDPEVQRLVQIASACGVSDRVRMLGQVAHEEVPDLFAATDIAVCVPWYEPFGIVPVEAMACGVPVVAASVGGLVDTVVDGVTGLHVPPRSTLALADALRRLVDDGDLRRRLGSAGAQRARSRYGWPQIAAATQSVYRHVTRGRVLADGGLLG